MYKIPQSVDSYKYLTGFSYWRYLNSPNQIEAKWADILEKEVALADSLKFNTSHLFIIIVDFEELYTGAPGEFYKQIIESNV